MARAPQHERDERMLRGDFDLGGDDSVGLSRRAENWRQTYEVIKLRAGLATAAPPKSPCGCRACVQARAERVELAKQRAYDMAKIAVVMVKACAGRDALLDASAARDARAQLPTTKANKCDCPACQPPISARIEATAATAPNAVAAALRFGGWQTPDHKRIGAGRYVGGGDV